MNRFHRVTRTSDLVGIAATLAPKRASAKTRGQVLAALLEANPGLRGESVVAAGEVVLVPPGLTKVPLHDEPRTAEVDDLMARLWSGIDSLVSGAAGGEERRLADKRSAQRVLASSAVRRRADRDPDLALAVEAGRSDLRADDVAARRSAARLAESAEQWKQQLEQLRALLSG
jgi:hypothetical protein